MDGSNILPYAESLRFIWSHVCLRSSSHIMLVLFVLADFLIVCVCGHTESIIVHVLSFFPFRIVSEFVPQWSFGSNFLVFL